MLHFNLDILYFVKYSILDKTCCSGQKHLQTSFTTNLEPKKQQTRGNDQDQ